MNVQTCGRKSVQNRWKYSWKEICAEEMKNRRKPSWKKECTVGCSEGDVQKKRV